jgi:hypothetical protein
MKQALRSNPAMVIKFDPPAVIEVCLLDYDEVYDVRHLLSTIK